MQLWSQNIQDLGVCEELVSRDDFDIPDVDLTFRNFEDLFGGDQDPIRALLHDIDVSFSFTEGDMSLDKSENARSQAMEVRGISLIFFPLLLVNIRHFGTQAINQSTVCLS